MIVLGILFVYDVTNQQSFDDLEDWMKVARNVLAATDMIAETENLALGENSNSIQSKANRRPAHFALVGNKIDLQHMIAISPERHNKFAADNAMSSHLVCASRSDGIQLMVKKVDESVH